MEHKPNPVDVHVGKKLRERRSVLGITQEKLGRELGLTFQQVQKYERGANRIGASRLFQLCRILDVGPNHFFEGLSLKKNAPIPGMSDAEQAEFDPEKEMTREVMKLVQAFRRIPGDKARQGVIDLAKALAADGKG